MNLGNTFSTKWITNIVTLLNPFYVKDIETYTSKSNVQVKNTIGSVASITGIGGSSPTAIVLKRCKCIISINANFTGSTNGIGVSIRVDATAVQTGVMGGNPSAATNGDGAVYASILEVGEVIDFSWDTSTTGSRDLSMLLEEI